LYCIEIFFESILHTALSTVHFLLPTHFYIQAVTLPSAGSSQCSQVVANN